MVLGHPLAESSKFLFTATVLAEVAAGQLAARIDGQSCAETARGLQLLGHNVDVNLR